MHVDLIVILNIIVFIVIAIASITAMIMDKKNRKKYYESDETYDCNSDHFDLIFQMGIAIICVCAVVVSLFAMSI